MASSTDAFSRLEAKRQEQVPQALARLMVVGLFIALWGVLFVARIPMPVPFLVVLVIETLFFLGYLALVPRLPTVRWLDVAQDGMLACEIVFHTTMVYFLGGITWLGAFAYVFGLIFSNTFLDRRRGLLYTTGAAAAYGSLIVLESTGAIPHQVYLAQGPLRYTDTRFVVTTLIGGIGVFYSIYLWVNWVGFQLRRERDAALRAREGLLQARAELERVNEQLEARVQQRTAELELVNAALRQNEERLRTVIDNAPVVLFAIDSEGTFSLSEGKGLEALGLAPGEAVGQSAYELYKDVPDVLDCVRRALGGEAFSATVQVGDLWFETYYAPVRDSEERVAGLIGISTDISESKRAEEALRSLERQNELILNSAGEGIYGIDLNGRARFVNPAAARLLGWERADLADAPLHNVLHHSHADGTPYNVHDCPIYTAFRDGAVHRVSDEVFWKKDGTSFPVEYVSTPIRDERGALVGAVVAFNDITERMRAEEALRRSEAILRGTIDATEDGILVLGPNGAVVHVNSRFTDLWAMPSEIADTRDIERYIQWTAGRMENAEDVIGRLREAFLAGTEGLETIELTDGRVFESFSRPLVREAVTEGRVFSFRDVTERRRADEALRDSESKFRSMAETVAVAVFIYQGTKMRYVNAAAEALTGYSRAELEAMDFWDVIHSDYRELVRERGMARQRGADVPPRYEVKIQTKSGEARWVDFTAGRITYGDKAAVLGTAFDITERKRAEEALREHANRDPLTGLLNRRAGYAALQERLAEARTAGRPFAVLVLDLDRFKAINDTFNHETGDNALLQFAQVMSDLVGDRGVVARLGGDEFEIGLDGAEVEEAVAFAGEVHTELRRAIDNSPGMTAVRFTVSIGVAGCPDNGDDLVDLSRLADQAMYHAKAAGGARTRTWRQVTSGEAA